MKMCNMITGFFLKWSRTSKIVQNVIFDVKLKSLIMILMKIKLANKTGIII